jgi:hypothetical protein
VEVLPDHFVPLVGLVNGRLPGNTKSVSLVSFLIKNHSFCHPSEGPDMGR